MIMFGGSHGNRESIDNLSESAVGRMFSIYARGVGGGQEAVEGRSIADEAGGGLQFFERLPLVPAVHEQRLGFLPARFKSCSREHNSESDLGGGGYLVAM